MTDEQESGPGAPEDALITALYLRAEQSSLPGQPAYEIEKGLRRFRAWLDDQILEQEDEEETSPIPADLPARGQDADQLTPALRKHVAVLLEAFEVSDDTKAMYQQMLQNPYAGVEELAAELNLTEDAIRSGLDELAELSLMRPSWEDPGRLRPVSPVVGLQSLLDEQQVKLLHQQHQFEQSRATLALVVADMASTRQAADHVEVEELIGIDAIRERLAELTHQTSSEVMAFMDGRQHSPAALDAGQLLDRELLGRGVALRTITLNSARNHPPTYRYAQWLTSLGGQVRSTPVLPMRMTIIDRKKVMIPLDPANSKHGAALLSGASVVAAMCALFEEVWQNATPLGVAPPRSEKGLSSQEITVLRLMAQGHTDDAIARQMKVSPRTVRRICRDLMAQLGARGRFQAGIRAAERGWLGLPPRAPSSPPGSTGGGSAAAGTDSIVARLFGGRPA